jgi:hypothetical protein
LTDTIKVLAQSAPAAGILTVFYTVPSVTSTTVSSIIICNVSGSNDEFSISIAIAGATDTLKQYIYYNTPLDTNDTFIATIGITLASSDVIRVLSNGGYLSFNLCGVEIT